MLMEQLLERAKKLFTTNFKRKEIKLIEIGENCLRVGVINKEALTLVPDAIYVPDPAPMRSVKMVNIEKFISGEN